MFKALLNVVVVFISPNKESQILCGLLCDSEAALQWPNKASKEKKSKVDANF